MKGNYLKHTFWGEAVSAANQLRNKSPASTQITTPYQVFTGEKPNLNTVTAKTGQMNDHFFNSCLDRSS